MSEPQVVRELRIETEEAVKKQADGWTGSPNGVPREVVRSRRLESLKVWRLKFESFKA